jgi:hypothetical protein
MLPLWFPKLILSLCGNDRCETGEADGVKGTILVRPVRKIDDQLVRPSHLPLFWGDFSLQKLRPERWSNLLTGSNSYGF